VRYYQRANTPAIIGDKDFKAWVYDELLQELEAQEKAQVILPGISMEAIVKGVASVWNTSPVQLTEVVKGPQKGNDARKIAMYLCQEMADAKLKDIAEFFKLSHVGSVSFITHQVRKKKREDKLFSSRINKTIKSIMKQAT
jgi:chromosomal replication initiation ATPase DnaA